MHQLRKYFKKKIILIDRFTDSTIAYQHYGLGVDISLINFINKHHLKNFKVDFTFLNIVNNRNMIKRLKLRKSLNRYDRFNKNFYQKVQKGFLDLYRNNKKKYLLVNSNLDKKKNKNLIINKIDNLI